jgi:hypothetical protein
MFENTEKSCIFAKEGQQIATIEPKTIETS